MVVPNTLYGKLSAALLGLLAVTGIVFIAISLWTTQRYIQEVNQRLHIDVADHLVDEVILMEDDEVNQEGLDQIFHMMMVINPGIEIYLLDPTGEILEYSAPPGRVKATHISLDPIMKFLDARPESLPFTGDDPRAPGRRRAFSAARIGPAEDPQGYLYVVLGGERYASVVQLLAGSHILRLSVLALGGCLLLAVLVGLIAFRMLTRRLRRLRSTMDQFEASGFTEAVVVPGVGASPRPDEIDDVAASFSRLSQEMIRQLERARSADVLRRELVANVSHDLRTPLASLTAFLETLQLKGAELPEAERRRYIDLAYRHSQSLAVLVTRLFELAKLEARETRPNPEPFSLGELVQDVAQKFELSARSRQINIRTEIPVGLPFIHADLQLIERVLDNLLDNAIRHTPDGGQVTIALTAQEEGVQVEVRDTGEGIPPEDLPFVFERFYQAARERDATRGSGLGLAIAQRITELHGGAMEVTSDVGRGTSFRFKLGGPPAQAEASRVGT